MRVLLITGMYPRTLTGGAELQTQMLAQGLHERGHELHYLATNAHVHARSRLNDIEVTELPGADIVGTPRHREYLEGAISESRPDVCYVRRFGEFLWTIPLCKAAGIPVVSVSCSGRDVSPFPYEFGPRQLVEGVLGQGFLRHFLNFQAMREAHARVCNASALKERIEHWHRGKTARVIYNGHPLPPEECTHRIYSRRVIWVNNVKRFKRPELFIRLAPLFPKTEFAMIGRIEDQGQYNKRIRDLIANGPANLKYLGPLPIETTNAEIAKSDVLFYTSTAIGEGFGNSFIQAWMRAVPTISLDYDPDGIIEREHIGFCSRSFRELVDRTGELIDDQSMLQDMGQRARQYARDHHSRERMIAEYDGLFRELANRPVADSGTAVGLLAR